MHAHAMHIQVGDETHDPFLGDDKLYEKREEQLRKRVNHRAMARKRDADRWEETRPLTPTLTLTPEPSP